MEKTKAELGDQLILLIDQYVHCITEQMLMQDEDPEFLEKSSEIWHQIMLLIKNLTGE